MNTPKQINCHQVSLLIISMFSVFVTSDSRECITNVSKCLSKRFLTRDSWHCVITASHDSVTCHVTVMRPHVILSLVRDARCDPAARPDTGDTDPYPEISSSFYFPSRHFLSQTQKIQWPRASFSWKQQLVPTWLLQQCCQHLQQVKKPYLKKYLHTMLGQESVKWWSGLSGKCQVIVRECQVNVRWSSGEI